MRRRADREMTVIKEEVGTHRSLETGISTPCRGTWRNTSVIQEAEEEEGRIWPETLLGFSREGLGEARSLL